MRPAEAFDVDAVRDQVDRAGPPPRTGEVGGADHHGVAPGHEQGVVGPEPLEAARCEGGEQPVVGHVVNDRPSRRHAEARVGGVVDPQQRIDEPKAVRSSRHLTSEHAVGSRSERTGEPLARTQHVHPRVDLLERMSRARPRSATP